jgi:predicted nucleic acid-binding protein
VARIDVAQYFFDTSALVKRYHKEDGTEQVRDIFAPTENLVRISTLGAVEIYSARAMKVRSGQLTRAAAQVLTYGFSRIWRQVELNPIRSQTGILPTPNA